MTSAPSSSMAATAYSTASSTAAECASSALAAVNVLVGNTERLNQAMVTFLKDVRAA